MQPFRIFRSSRKGVALVVALSLIVLLTFLVVSYLVSMQLDQQSTQNYSQSVKAQEMALGAIQEIVADLKKEIEAGSLQDPAKYKINGKSVYVPATSKSALPARIGFAADKFGTDASSNTLLPPTLIRVSRASDPFFTSSSADYPGTLPANRASAVNSTDPSANGRVFSAVRWNKPQMMGLWDSTKPANDLAVPSNFSADPPDWVYVTRAGSKVFQVSDLAAMKLSKNVDNSDEVLGRYAFVMYEEGGLLDVNTAGYPSTLSASTAGADAIRGKTALAYADLMQLPGMTVSGVTGKLDAFLNWRSKGSLAAPAFGNGSFVTMVQKLLPEGFLKFQQNDSPMVSRQDLIDYFKKKMGTTGPLPYLGTFSRALDAPSWAPAAATSFGYAANAENAAAINRNLANVRFKTGGTITHYDDLAQAQTYEASVGDPLIQGRFSLAKIGWLSSHNIGGTDPGSGPNPDTGAGPTSSYADAVRSCFGLSWGVRGAANGGNECWTYVGSDGGNAPVDTIKTLDQVASERREPNFFELLKASILSGSLGLGPGMTAWDNGLRTPYSFRSSNWDNFKGSENLNVYSFMRNGSVPSPIRIPDMQIMKIGASIIDQYDADSYPTAIYFKYNGITPTYDAATGGSLDTSIFGDSTMAYGNENLPYLNGLYHIAGTRKKTDTDVINGWIQPQIWNPHQIPAAPNSVVPPPTSYQIRAYGQANLGWQYQSWFTDTAKYGRPASQNFGDTQIPGTGLLDGSYINITCTAAGFQQLAIRPWAIGSSALTGVSCSPAGANSTRMSADPEMQDYDQNHFVAFWLGDDSGSANTYHVFPDNYPSTTSRQCSYVYLESVGSTFGMGWIDSRGRYHPYSYIINPVGYSYGVIGTEKNGAATPYANTGSARPSGTGNDCHFVLDGRTTRFGSLSDWGSKMYNTTLYPNVGNFWVGGRYADTYSWGKPNYPSNFVFDTSNTYGCYEVDWMFNDSAKTTYYRDLDGVVRPGDGIYGNPATGDGMPLYTGTTLYPGYATQYGQGVPTGSPAAAGDMKAGVDNLAGNISHGRRSVVLNRPFRSVGELGYAYRDQPFKSLDFFSSLSADAALLDVFSVTDQSRVAANQMNSVVAGQFNPNAAPSSVFKSVLSGASLKDYDRTYNITNSSAMSLAGNITNYLNPSGPSASRNLLANRSNLVTNLAPVMRNSFTNSADLGNKAYFEGPVRALADVTNTRTWNLMIDVVAQSGRMAPNATSLDQFLVQGERRYWMHIAIDRFTGKILDQQLEPVYE